MTCKSLNLHNCIGCCECLPSAVAHQSHEIRCQHAINYKVLAKRLEALECRVERDRANWDAARPEPACDVKPSPLSQWRLVIIAHNDSLPLVDMTLEEVIAHGLFYGSQQWEQKFRPANNTALTVRIVPA
jgi:hypothetical protein